MAANNMKMNVFMGNLEKINKTEVKMGKLSEKTKSIVKKEMDYWKIPGCAISVLKDGKLYDSMGFGYRNMEGNLPVTADTQFGIASISKSMTSALIAVLADKGILSYDEPVTTYAPKLIMYDPKAKNMTLRDMLSHKTGFGTHDALWPGDKSREELAESMKFIKPCTDFRGEAIYSNVIYALVGYVAECAVSETWDDLMQKYIFDPLYMHRTNCSVNIMKKDINFAVPYRYRNGRLNPLNIWNLDMAGPAASVNSTANDMAKWLKMHIDGGKTQYGSMLIKPETFKEMHSVQSVFSESLGKDGEFYECNNYAMGWRTGYYKGRSFHKHTGKIEGYSSIQAFLPEAGIGAAILINLHSPSVSFMYGVLYTLLDEMLGEKYEDWAGKFHGDELPTEETYRDCDANYFKEEQVPGTYPSLPLNEYAGTYYDKGYGTININYENNVLYMQYRDMNIPLKHYHHDVFRADDVLEDVFLISLPLTFNLKSGAAESVSVRFEEMVPDIVFNKDNSI
jgi:CubicO group peptidase (beta-lactamase class C family)